MNLAQNRPIFRQHFSLDRHTMLHTQLLSQLRTFLDDDVFPHDAQPYLIDQRQRYTSEAIVVQPKTVEQIQAIVRFCNTHKISLTPQGGNTGLVGGSYATEGIILNLSKLNRIRHLNLSDNTITVEAGCILQNVQLAAEQAQRFFPLSLASEGSCQIGGNIACNAGGLNVVKYGTMRQLVLGLEVVLPNGELISQLHPLHKNTTAYELKHLFIGSEGTLGIITAATLQLFAPAQTTETIWVGVEHIHQATHLLQIIQNQFAERVCSFELISNFALQLSAQYSHLNPPLQANWHILIELTDSLPQAPLAEAITDLLIQHQFDNALLAQSEQQRKELWTLRENISPAQKALGVSIKHDIATPIEEVADFVQNCEQALQHHFPNIQIVVFGHLGDGSLHYNTFLPTQTDSSVYEKEEAINTIVYQQIQKHKGTIAAEHGIGCLKNHWLPLVRNEAEIALMRAIKQQFDPNNILNPNKLLP